MPTPSCRKRRKRTCRRRWRRGRGFTCEAAGEASHVRWGAEAAPDVSVYLYFHSRLARQLRLDAVPDLVLLGVADFAVAGHVFRALQGRYRQGVGGVVGQVHAVEKTHVPVAERDLVAVPAGKLAPPLHEPNDVQVPVAGGD